MDNKCDCNMNHGNKYGLQGFHDIDCNSGYWIKRLEKRQEIRKDNK